MTSPLLNRPGAVPADGPDTGVAWHYGDPVGEQRALVSGKAVVDLSHRGVLRLSGPDRLIWLNSLTTQKVDDLAPGSSAQNLVLSPNGHIEHDLHLVDDGEHTWITVEPGTSASLTEWLVRMRFRADVEIDDVTSEYAVLADCIAEPGPEVTATWIDPWPRTAENGYAYCRLSDSEHPGSERPWRERILPATELETVTASAVLAGTWAAEALRIAAWRPRIGLDSDHRTIAHELDLLRTAVHLQKGCYRGQETIARVKNLGRPPRRLVFLHLDGSEHELPTPGTDLTNDGRRVGHLTSAARHHELGPIGLGLVRRNTPEDAVLLAGAISAAQETIVAP